MYFRNQGLRKTSLDNRLKSRISDAPLKDNMANGLKHCCNLNDSTFTILLNPC